MPDSLKEVSLSYRSFQDLIILPVTINDSIHVNLILDTGCRNLVLFGKRFQSLFALEPKAKVQFSGLGSGKPVSGSVALHNKVSISEVLGHNIPVVVVPGRNVFMNYKNIHGVIGYDVFIKFEVEVNPFLHQITFRPALQAELPAGFSRVPIRVDDSRPLINCEVVFSQHRHLCDLMIDTGSTLGLLLKTSDLQDFELTNRPEELGRGFNGSVLGYRLKLKKLVLASVEIPTVETGIIHSEFHNNASIGMHVLKNYTLVLNYCKGYAGFRKEQG